MNTIYDVDYFINKFERVPDALWYTGDLYDVNRTRFCAAGMCGLNDTNRYTLDTWTKEAKALFDLFYDNLQGYIGSINDGNDKRYQQPTPKQRILAALRDIKAKIQKENNTGCATTSVSHLGEQVTSPELAAPSESKTERVIYKTVVIDTPVKELTDKELCQQ